MPMISSIVSESRTSSYTRKPSGENRRAALRDGRARRGEQRSRLDPHPVRSVEVEYHATDLALMREIGRADLERDAVSDLSRGCRGAFGIGDEPDRR